MDYYFPLEQMPHCLLLLPLPLVVVVVCTLLLQPSFSPTWLSFLYCFTP